jgi:parallel beta-helix repeat protein
MPSRFLIIIISFVTISGIYATDVSGTISSNTTWTKANSPYVVTGNITVSSGVTLTVEAGVTVKFNTSKVLLINGALIAIGTSSDSIRFTSDESSPSSGDWGYLKFTNSSTDASYDGSGNYSSGSIIKYCVVNYGTGIELDGAHPHISNSSVRKNSNWGINGASLTTTIKIIDSKINYNNGGIKLAQSSGLNAVIDNNVISNNTNVGIFAQSGSYTISNNTISSNTVSSDPSRGAGINFWGSGTISNNVIKNNVSNDTGGAIHIYDGTYYVQ